MSLTGSARLLGHHVPFSLDPLSLPIYCPEKPGALKAEKLAGLEKLKGSLWHAYRRKWATERKHLPGADVAAAGGWANELTLLKVYEQPDPETMLMVVLGGGELRERKA